jgi:hypothetical protein
MNHGRSLVFEALEGRMLLSGAHAAGHGAKARDAAAVPLVLDGTLTVNNRQAISNPDSTTSTTTNAVPIVGLLSGLGKVHGYWYEETDNYGDDLGPDVLSLHSSQGTFTVDFNDATSGPAHSTGHGTVYYQHAQIARGDTGDFSGETESGTLNLNMNRAHTEVQSITLNTQST